MFDRTVRAVARPAVQMWLTSSELQRAAIPVPPPTAAVHTTGNDPERILLVGSGIGVGFGVLSHDLSLAGSLARRLAALTGRAMSVDVVADRLMTAQTSLAVLAAKPIVRYDSVVLTLGLIESLGLVDLEEWRRTLAAALDQLRSAGAASLQVFVVGLPRLDSLMRYPALVAAVAGRHARLLNEETERLCGSRAGVTYLPFDPPPAPDTKRFRSPETYGVWADILAPTIAERLVAVGPDEAPIAAEPFDEIARQITLDELAILDTAPEDRYDRITRAARDLFGTASSALTFIDTHRHWFKSSHGVETDQMPRVHALCDVTIQHREHFSVPDAALDTRFADNPMVAGEPFLRFYAGYPIEAPNGVRIGTLSVWDPAPRGFTASDAALLRGLALRAQDELRTPPAA